MFRILILAVAGSTSTNSLSFGTSGGIDAAAFFCLKASIFSLAIGAKNPLGNLSKYASNKDG